MTISPMTIDERLAVDKFAVDEDNAHIELVENPARDQFDKLVKCCPAGLYRYEEDGSTSFDYAGCLECGTCRILCGDTILSKWENPAFGNGVSYRFG